MSYKCNTGKGQIETGNNESFEARLESRTEPLRGKKQACA
jgi:hypothetical protein